MNALIRNFLFLTSISLFAIAGCGDASVLIGPAVSGVTRWYEGEAHRYYDNDVENVYRASKHALNELNLQISKDEIKRNRHHIIAGEKNRFSIKIYEAEKGHTRMNIRINFWGDKDYAELIYKKTQEQLETLYFDQGKPTSK